MIIRGTPNAGEPGRTLYALDGFQTTVTHFVIRQTTPAQPFGPHRHAQPEMWYIMAGAALLLEDGAEHPVGAGDLITIQPWVEHGLRTDGEVSWICLG